jgi:DNA-binding protein HU-beta
MLLFRDDGLHVPYFCGIAEALREQIGAPMWQVDRPEYARRVAGAREQVDPSDWEAAWMTGRALSWEQAADEKSGVTQKASADIVNAALMVISEALARGEKVTLTGFGTFEVRERQACEGVNPQTCAKMSIPASKTPGFSASSTLKDAVKG